MTNVSIRTKRAYAEPSEDDGFRILVDRLWPRGVSKERLALGMWAKDVAPSGDLRKWFNHDPERFDGFRSRYMEELDSNPAAEDLAGAISGYGTVTLLFAAKDEERNNAVVLKEWLDSRLRRPCRPPRRIPWRCGPRCRRSARPRSIRRCCPRTMRTGMWPRCSPSPGTAWRSW